MSTGIQRPDQTLPITHPREVFILPMLQQAVKQAILQYRAELSSNAKILDVGCGRQPYRSLLEKDQVQYYSLDVNQNEEKTVHFLGRIDEPLSDTLLKAGPFDLILLTEVLEHVFDLDKCFRNLSRILSANGKIILTCPFFFPLHEKPFDFWRITPFGLDQLCKKYELKIIDQRQLGSSLECWGLINGHLLSTMRYHKPKHFWNRLMLSLQQRFVRIVLKTNLKLILSGVLKPYIGQDQDFYVSNYFVLENDRITQNHPV